MTNPDRLSNAAQIEWHSRFGRKKLEKVAYNVTRNKETALDAVATAFFDAWRRHESLWPNSNIGKWLSTVTHNRAHDLLRQPSLRMLWSSRTQNTKGEWADLAEEQEDPNTPEGLYLSKEACGALWAAVATLPLPQLEAIMGYARDETENETAERLSIKVGTVKSRIHYARKKLAAAMKED